MIEAVMHFPPGHGAFNWSKRHSAGEVPDKWLYGLHSLGRNGVLKVTPSELQVMSKRDRLTAFTAAARRKHARGRPSASSPLHIAWDELRATHMLTQVTGIGRAACGAIWCIDEQLRRPLDPRNFVVRDTLRAMDTVWCLVSAQVPLLTQWLGTGPTVTHVPFGIDTSFFQATAPALGSGNLVLSLGNDRDRDSRTLIESLELILAHDSTATAAVQCGDELTLPDRVVRLPHLTHRQVRDYLQRCAVVLLPTRPNTHFSGMTVALEAMSTGRAVVATNTMGASEYVQNGATGTLVAAGDTDGFASAVLSLLGDCGQRARIGDAAAEDVRRRFQSSMMADRLTTVLMEGKHGHPSAPGGQVW